MERLYRYLAACSIAVVVSAATSAGASGEPPLKRVADLPLPGNATRLDYQSLDQTRHLLFIAHLGDGEVIAVDTKQRRVLATIKNISDVHGVLAVPALNTVYASATGTNEIVAIDESTFKIVARTEGGIYPDGIAFDPLVRRIFVSDERGGTDTVIDTRTNRRVATIELGGEAGNTQYDAASHHVFVNVQTLGQLVEIDPATNRIVNRFYVGGSNCTSNHGLLVDAPRRRAFIACEESGSLSCFDMRSKRVVEHWKVGGDPDVLALDPVTRRLFVAAEDGTLTLFLDGDRVSRLWQHFFAPEAHTVAVDPLTHRVYFPLENLGGKPVLRIMEQTP